VVYGNPAKPMTREAHIAKFMANAAAGVRAVPAEQARTLVQLIDGLEEIKDATRIVDLLMKVPRL
jgi:hypothetical protein